MTNGPESWRLLDSALVLLLLLFLMSGCASTAQPERPTQIARVVEQLPESDMEAQQSETTTSAGNDLFAEPEIDVENSIFFSLGSSTLNQHEIEKLRHLSTLLKSNKALHVTLTGHANDNGSSSFNLAVADARVRSVVTALTKAGVKRHQIKKNVVGDAKTSSTCRSAECRRKTRRVELVISKNR